MSYFVEFTEVYETSGNFKFSKHGEASASSTLATGYSLRKVIINAAHVVSLREETNYEKISQSKALVDGLDSRQKFTKVQLANGGARFNSYIVVVGDISSIIKKIQNF